MDVARSDLKPLITARDGEFFSAWRAREDDPTMGFEQLGERWGLRGDQLPGLEWALVGGVS
ncbi:MAG: hypothetical protein ACJA2W_004037 [Planctomycetota bacterium]|jgi:hypothetical protein